MANIKISQLTAGNPAQSTDIIPIDRAGANFSITAGSIAALAPASAWATLAGDLTETQVIPWDGPTPGTPDSGISRIGAASLAIGNGVARDVTGALSLSSITTNNWNGGILTVNDDDGLTPWQLSGSSFANSGGGRKNQVARLGWNVASGGGPVVAGETASAVEWESYFVGDFGPTDPAMEMHLVFYDTSGNSYRWQSADFDRSTHVTNVSSAADNWIWLRRSDGAILLQVVSSGQQFDFNQGMGLLGFSALTGTVTTSGTAVTWVSGSTFSPTMNGMNITINSVAYTVSTVTSTTALTLTTSAGVQGTAVAYTSSGGTWSVNSQTGVGTFTDHVAVGQIGYASSGTGVSIFGLSTQGPNMFAINNENGLIFSIDPTGNISTTKTLNIAASQTISFAGGQTPTLDNAHLTVGNSYVIRWNSSGADTSISRTAAGVIGIGTGATGSTAGALALSRINSSSADMQGKVSSAPTGITASNVVVAVGAATGTFTVTSTEGFTVGDTVTLSAGGWTGGSGLASSTATVTTVTNTTSMVLTRVSGGPWVAGTYSAQTGTLTQTGGTTVSVVYATAYTSIPTVVVTPTSNAGAFFLSASAITGFTITYANSGTQTFNYIVMGNPN